jgi:hypothetical protein
MVYPYSDDAKSVLHAEDFEFDEDFALPNHDINCVDFYDVWDLRPCMIKSNLASGVQHNYLGHTNVRYDPLKYYRINNNDNSFTFELMFGNSTKIPVLLPFDDVDPITLEYVILQNATELYT